ncbi:MAG: hypothetical protein F2653_02050 [Actinobacteria bacterium]|uniref:Unannotated protein n=1 Tax=freshwater metagenome TaxID=449393 RepID=A0A6J6Q4A4_9ZZZZ|nr:hypothetical protein [Actinomycetota bacterium]MSW21866.1 hypothetical protein [Actinomycetota bacterium]MSX03677.1 hypothetical protein [Actinomycetota bacterium]MSX60982.1 hypothetical protein [Actinomycetota bacterium]MSX84016.1 hypothetical protein [Actinomycetota bacterium]
MEYVAGSCNIGKGEIRRRQFVALIGLVLIVVTTFGLLTGDAAKSARFSVFIPALVFSVGFIQSRRKFCLAFGLMGTFNFGSLGKLSRVASAQDRLEDRKTAISILLQALSLALTITLLIYLLPL